MIVTPHSAGVPPTGGGRATLSNAFALLCLLLALLFPLALLLYAGVVLVKTGLAYPLVFVYNAVDYFGVPVLLLAMLLGHLSQLAAIHVSSPTVKRRLASSGLLIGYGSLVFIMAAFGIALAVSR